MTTRNVTPSPSQSSSDATGGPYSQTMSTTVGSRRRSPTRQPATTAAQTTATDQRCPAEVATSRPPTSVDTTAASAASCRAVRSGRRTTRP